MKAIDEDFSALDFERGNINIDDKSGFNLSEFKKTDAKFREHLNMHRHCVDILKTTSNGVK